MILGQEVALQKEMATHSSILAGEIPRTEEPDGLHIVQGVAKRIGLGFATKQQESRFETHSLFKNPRYLRGKN